MDKADEIPPSSSTVLPLTRMKSIMKSKGASQLNKEATFLLAKSTELFVQHFAREAHATSQKNGGNGNIKYEHLAHLVDNSENLDFLLQYVPKKISVKEFKELLLSGDADDDDTDDED